MKDMDYTDFANGEVRWKKYCECKQNTNVDG